MSLIIIECVYPGRKSFTPARSIMWHDINLNKYKNLPYFVKNIIRIFKIKCGTILFSKPHFI